MRRWSDVSALTLAGAATNEDWVAFSDTALVVVDGATGLNGSHVMRDWGSDAAWFSHRLCDLLLPGLEQQSGSIGELLHQCIGILRQEFLNQCGSGVLLEEIQPSAALVLARFHEDRLEIFRLGDAMGIIGHRDGTATSCREENLGLLDSAVLDKMVHLASAEGMSVKDARRLVGDDLLANRRLMNRAEGYWTTDLTGRGIAHGKTASWVADQIDEVLLTTDGFSAALDILPDISSPADLLDCVRRSSIWHVKSSVVELLESDPEWSRFPRFKDRDDISVVRASIARV